MLTVEFWKSMRRVSNMRRQHDHLRFIGIADTDWELYIYKTTETRRTIDCAGIMVDGETAYKVSKLYR
jgi:hypothetical protein